MREPRTEKANSIYSNPDNDPRGVWTSVSYVSQRTKEQRPNLSYDMFNPITKQEVTHPINAWKYSKDQYEIHAKENRLYWGKEGNNTYPRLKRFLSELKDGMVPINLWNYKEVGTLDDGTKTVDGLIGKDIFDYPKPITLIQKMLYLATDNDSNAIVLDFFSGSATTAHAVMQLNAVDDGNRNFIMVQLPDLTDAKSEAFKQGYKNICEIGKERIRRAGSKVLEEWQNKQEQLSIGEDTGASPPDTGFRVLKLDTSNLIAWDATPISADTTEERVQTLWDRLDARDKTIKKDRTDLDIVFEIMLKMGVHLDYVVSEITVGNRKCYSIGEKAYETSADCLILVCLDFGITPEDITAMCDLAPAQIIAAEEAFEDSTAMSNAHYILKDRDIEMKLL